MATSRVPAAIDALVTTLRAAPTLAGVVVHDGYPGSDLEDADVLVVGWEPESGNSVEMRQDFNSAGARTRNEDFDILCWVQSWSGDADIAARRARAFALLAVVEDALRATGGAPTAPTLNNTVLWAHLTAAQVAQNRTQSGVIVGIAFRVTCRARI